MEPREPGVGPREPRPPRALLTPPLPLAARPRERTVPGGETGPTRVLAGGLLAGALACTATLVALGEPLPPVGPVLVLVAVLALDASRGALFTTELAATSEAAVMFCAIVGLRDDSGLLGPIAVALAFGAVDFHQWRERSWTRMAYNAGYQGLAVLAAALIFRACTATSAGTDVPALVGAALVAVGPYVLVGSACGVVLLRTLGERSWAAACRHQWVLHQMVL